MNWVLKEFAELTAAELHDLLELRIQVFVVEQRCAYPEVDGKDLESTHLLGYRASELVAYARWYAATDHVVLGRVVTRSTVRRQGVAQRLLKRAFAAIGPRRIQISAQQYLEPYYQRLGFETVSGVYDDFGIPHIDMIKDQSPEDIGRDRH